MTIEREAPNWDRKDQVADKLAYLPLGDERSRHQDLSSIDLVGKGAGTEAWEAYVIAVGDANEQRLSENQDEKPSSTVEH